MLSRLTIISCWLLLLPLNLYSQNITGINLGILEFDGKISFMGDIKGLQANYYEVYYQRQFKSNLLFEAGAKFLKTSTAYRGYSYNIIDSVAWSGIFKTKRLELDLLAGYTAKLWPWTYVIIEMGVVNSYASEKARDSEYDIVGGRMISKSDLINEKVYFELNFLAASTILVQLGKRFRIKDTFGIGITTDGRRRIEIDKGICFIVSK